MREYVDAVSGSGLAAADVGGGIAIGVERRFATRIIDSQRISVHGLEAYSATVEVANVDQLSLSPSSRWERTRIVLIRTPFRYHPDTLAARNRRVEFPVLMLVGYSNLPEDFDRGVPAFVRFVNAIAFLDAPTGAPRGVQVVGAEGPHAPTPTPPQQPLAPQPSPTPATPAQSTLPMSSRPVPDAEGQEAPAQTRVELDDVE